jgi:type VI secretion system protein ImpE
MNPETSLKEGRPDEALRLLTAEVKSNPADARRRVFMFQLLALLGQWERAQTQLNVVGELDPINALMVTTYTAVLKGEAAREAVFAGRHSPVVVGEPEQWLALLLQALKLDAEGRHAEAAPLREAAFEQAEAISGSIDGHPFEWIADADPRIGPCLEVILEGGYAWVPFARIATLEFEAPTDLRDKVWVPVQITWRNGGKAIGFVPGRYPGSAASGDNDFILARKTAWKDSGADVVTGLGQRMLATDADEYPLLDARTITFAGE